MVAVADSLPLRSVGVYSTALIRLQWPACDDLVGRRHVNAVTLASVDKTAGPIKIITTPAGAGAKYCDEYVCVSVCPRGYLLIHTGDLYQFFVHVAYVRGSVLLRQFDDRPHCLSAGRGAGSAQRGQSVIYDCLVLLR